MSVTRQRPRDPLDHEPAAVAYARDRAGLTMTQLAKACGVSVSLISEIEGGTRNATPEMLNKLAAALNCPRVVLERNGTNTAHADRQDPVFGDAGSAMTTNDDYSTEGPETVILAWELVGLTRTETEALIRFAAEFLCRAKYAPATPEGLEGAYVDTVPIKGGYEDVHVFMQDLAERMHDALGENFGTWTHRKLLVQQPSREIANLTAELTQLSSIKDAATCHRVFSDLVTLEQRRRQAAKKEGPGPHLEPRMSIEEHRDPS